MDQGYVDPGFDLEGSGVYRSNASLTGPPSALDVTLIGHPFSLDAP